MTRVFTGILGIVLLVAGLVGAWTGGHDHALVVFGINASHNWVHILSGAVALAIALWWASYAKFFCILFGLVYGAVAVAGFLGIPSVVQALNLNMPDQFLHLAIAAGCLWAGIAGFKR